MSNQTSIEWTNATWNPITGCTQISEGCRNCYAKRMAKRLAGRYGYPANDPFAVTVHHDHLEDPYHWKKSRMIFVCSMGDLFHENIETARLLQIAEIMQSNPRHIFQVLTKRPERLNESWALGRAFHAPNIWLGVTAENQKIANKRIPILINLPATVRFVSIEPMLEPINLYEACGTDDNDKLDIDWVICGGETGPEQRRMDGRWVEFLIHQCSETNTPFFFKQWHCKQDRKFQGKLWEEMPK